MVDCKHERTHHVSPISWTCLDCGWRPPHSNPVTTRWAIVLIVVGAFASFIGAGAGFAGQPALAAALCVCGILWIAGGLLLAWLGWRH